MERNFYTDSFEKLLKEKSDEFRMYPSKRVWHSIYNDLHPSRKWPSMAMSMLLVIALLLIGYLNTSDNTSKTFIARNEAKQTANDKLAADPRANGNTVQHLKQPADNELNSDNNDNADISGNSNTNADLTNTNITGSTTNIVTVADGNNNDLALNNGNSNGNNNSSSTVSKTTTAKDKNVVEEMGAYISNSQLLTDIAIANKNKKAKPGNNNAKDNTTGDQVDAINGETNKTALQNTTPGNLAMANKAKEEKNTIVKNEKPAVKPDSKAADKTNANDERSWIEDYALHNKSSRKKWKDRTEMEFYVTPGVGYRKLSSNARFEPTAVTSLTATPPPSSDVNKSVSQKPGMGLEAGFGLAYAVAKNIRLKAGVQLNYTSYGINANETYHPVLTTLMLNDLNTGYSYLSPRTTTLSNIPGAQKVTVHNKTYQVSVPVGIAVKLAGKNKLEWYAGATVQPSLILGGTAQLPSSDYQSYVVDPSLMRKWNMNTSVETYINYKLGNYSLQVGPQLRYQVLSTYSKKYTLNEKLYNMGLKVGLVKSF